MVIDTSQCGLSVAGQVNLKLYNEHGDLINEQAQKNIVTNAGAALILGKLVGGIVLTSYPVNLMQIGLGTTAATSDDTGLQSPTGGQRTATGTTIGNTTTYSATFPAGVGVGIIREAALFTTSTPQLLFARTVFNEVNKYSGDSLVITWAITIS